MFIRYSYTKPLPYRALQSPAILERSGIGKRDVLEKAGIAVKLELPGVGENLQEHIVSVAAWGMLMI
jgi:choline dehydrogenase-like flavoprotein